MPTDHPAHQHTLAAPAITVELFGVPRMLHGQATVTVDGATLGEIGRALRDAAPALAGPVLDPASGWPNDGYIFVVAGRFTRDPATPVAAAAAVLLVSSVAGG